MTRDKIEKKINLKKKSESIYINSTNLLPEI